MTLSFDLAPAARKSDPLTSKRAASRINFGRRRNEILLAFSRYADTGAATFEIADDLCRPRDTVSPHVAPLKAMGLLRSLDRRRVNPATGNECEVYAVTDKFLSSELFDSSIWGVRLQNNAKRYCCKNCGTINEIN